MPDPIKDLTNPDDVSANDARIDTAMPSVIFDQGARRYWWLSARDEWVPRDVNMARSFLKASGLSGAANKDEKQSEVDAELLRISNLDYVSYAGPLAGWNAGLYNEQGQRFLVTRSPRLIEPTPGEFPVIDRMLAAILAGAEAPESEDAAIIDQRPYFFAWWKFALQCLRECYPERGLCMVLAGDAGCGKTLLKELVRLSFGGREVYPYSFMTGQDNFNAEMLGSELWTVDDETADTSMKARVAFGAQIKKITANSATRFRGMLREAVTLTTFKRLFICVNREPDRLVVLPPIDDDISGKLALMMAYNSQMFVEVEHHSTTEKKAFWATLNGELPHFLHWLLFEFEAGEEMNARLGSPAYHHPDIGRELFTLSPEMVLLEQLDRVFSDYFSSPINDFWRGSAAALRNMMVASDSPLSSSEVKKIPASNWLGKNISKLSIRFPDRFIHHRSGRGCEWSIYRPDEGFDYTAGGLTTQHTQSEAFNDQI